MELKRVSGIFCGSLDCAIFANWRRLVLSQAIVNFFWHLHCDRLVVKFLVL